jgi:S-formylglutathione hydrolase
MSDNWSSCDIAGKRADVYESSQPPRFGVLYLHSLSEITLRDDPVFTPLFRELRLACICPHGRRSWWTDRVCGEFDPALTAERYLLEQVVPEFGRRWGLSERTLGLLGISMGGQGALRLAFKHPRRFSVVAGIASAVDYYELHGQGAPLDEMYDSKEQCRQDSAPLHLHPTDFPAHIFFCVDPDDAQWYRGNDRLHEKMNALGVPHEVDFSTRAGGHSWDYYRHMAERAVRFLAAGLEAQSLRLL